MKLNRIRSHELEKCYCAAPLIYNKKLHILVAAEKVNKCLLFDPLGNQEDTIWDGPGGTMSIVQIPEKDGEFLATHMFYSPNDSQNARIVYVKPNSKTGWDVQTIVDLPFVHRFDILKRGGKNYIIACTVKSDHHYKDDWRFPGKIFVCELPNEFAEGIYLEMHEIKSGLIKNHGYCKKTDQNGEYAVVSSESGIYRVIPPSMINEDWEACKILDEPASDVAFADLDGDGEDELLVITPFHGDTIKIFKKEDEEYREVFAFNKKYEFSHALWAGRIFGKDIAFLGHRKGERNLVRLYYDNGYRAETLDHDVGPANFLCYSYNGREYLVSTNREINEIAFYEIIGK